MGWDRKKKITPHGWKDALEIVTQTSHTPYPAPEVLAQFWDMALAGDQTVSF